MRTPETIVRSSYHGVTAVDDLVRELQTARALEADYSIDVAQAADGDWIVVVHVAAIDPEAGKDLHASVVTGRHDEVVTLTRAADVRPCGRCRLPKPAAVDFGCTCGRSREDLHAGAVEFARLHD